MNESDEFYAWLDRLIACYKHERSSRLQLLNGSRPKEWRGDGLHTLSHLWGFVDATTPGWFAEAAAAAPELLAPTPIRIREAATLDADAEWRRRVVGA